MRHVRVLHHVTPQLISADIWPANSHDLIPVDYRIWDMMQDCLYQEPIRDTDALWQRLVRTWVNFSRVWWTMRLISGKKDKLASMQRVVTLNTCCDIACLTFKLSHITTDSFHSHQRLGENNIPSVR